MPKRFRSATVAVACMGKLPSAGRAAAQAESIWRRVKFMMSSHPHRLEFRFPGGAVRTNEHPCRFRVADDLFPVSIPANAAAQTKGEIRQVTAGGDAVPGLQI